MQEQTPLGGNRTLYEIGVSILRWRPSSYGLAFFVWTGLAGTLIAYPLGMLFRESLFTAEGLSLGLYAEALQTSGLVVATFNSFVIAVGVTMGSILIAVPLGFFTTVTDMPFRRFFAHSAILTFAAPSFIAALGWILLLGPRGGLLNVWIQSFTGYEEGPFNIYGPWGIIFVLSLFSYPLVLLPVRAALSRMDASLANAAKSLGSHPLNTLLRIVFPLILPALVSGGLLTFATVFIVFGPVALLGSPVGYETLPTELLRLMRFPARIDIAAVMSVPVLIVIAGLLYAQRRILGRRNFALVGGKGAEPYHVSLGRGRWLALLWCTVVFTFSLVLPFGVLVLTSFRRAIGLPLSPENLGLDNYRTLIDHPTIISSIRNSLYLSVLATLASVAVGVLAAWLVERHTRTLRQLIPPVMLSPLAFPGALLGIALIVSFARPPFLLSGSLTILLIAYVIRTLPLSFQYSQAGYKQLKPEMEEAARSLGASGLTIMRRVTLPLLGGSLASVALLNFVLVFRELESSIFLYTGRNNVSAVVLFNLAAESRFGLMGAFSIVILAVNIVVIVIALRLPGSQLNS